MIVTGLSRPLVVRVAALGDTVLLTAMLRALSELWQQPCDVVVHENWADSVFTGLDSVAEVVGLSSRTTPYWLCPSQHRLVRWLRQRGPGPTWVIDNKQAMLHLLRRGRVPKEWMVTSFEVPWRQRQHHVDHLLEVARHRPEASMAPPGIFPDPVPDPELWVSSSEAEACRGWLGQKGWRGEPIVAVQTQSRRVHRGLWPDHCWEAAIRQVVTDLGESMVSLIGAPPEADAVQRVADRCGDLPVINVAGEMHLRRMFALLGLCHSCISLDTGPAHAAAALGRPVVVLICSTHPDEYRPVGPAARVEQVCALPRELWPQTQPEFAPVHHTEEIEPEEVVAAWRRVTLGHRSPRTRA